MAKYGLNKVTLIGNLGRDPELRYLDQGVALATVRMACTERSRDKEGNYVDRTEWITVNLWRSQAEIVHRYCRKGSTICVEGRLRNQSWESPEGEKRSRLDVDGIRVILLDSRPEGDPASEAANPVAKSSDSSPSSSGTPSPGATSSQAEKPAFEEGEEDDLPF